MERIGRIKPQYVWITSGTGRWTNEKSAEALAKRSAGIDKFRLVEVMTLDKTPFTVIGEEEFLKKSIGSKYAYMYGYAIQAQEGETVNGGDLVHLYRRLEWSYLRYLLRRKERKLLF